MTKTANRRRKVIMPISIKKKLSAAICMLLVAAIMMISSTYAWFTLSTAPEVRGISTTVGANGNLEIALLKGTALFSTADDLGIVSEVGDSMVNQSVAEANAKWGNLVDLSTAYGLNTVTLLPSALNIFDILDDNDDPSGNYKLDGSIPLLAPLYGSDGRVISVDQETLIAKYTEPSMYPLADRESDGNGVGVIGTASGRTERMKQYPIALGSASGSIELAKNTAQNMLRTNGDAVASLFLKMAMADTSTATFTKEEAMIVGTLLTGLESANGYVFAAIKSIALANTLSSANTATLTDEQVIALVEAVNDAADPTALAAVTNMAAFTTELNTAITQYTTTANKIAGARTAYNALGVEAAADTATFAYSAIKDIVDDLINKTYVTLTDGTTSITNPQRSDEEDLSAMVGNPIAIVLGEGSGALYEIAKLAGDYRATGITGHYVRPSGATLTVRQLSLSTQATSPILLPTAYEGVNNKAPQNAAGGTGTLDNAYGYVIDFGFRTNASGANLLLQEAARDRIYAENTENEQTLGGGTYVKFKTLDPNKFSLNDLRGLVYALRIVFAEPVIVTDENNATTVEYNIIAIAAPVITATTANGVTTYTGGVESDEDEDDENETLTVDLALYGFTVSEAVDGGSIVTRGDMIVDAEGEKDLTLTALPQNKAIKLSAIVYIDGDIVDNSMAANAEQSMTGTLNLQFTTDATLVPMENATLRGGEASQGDNQQTLKQKLDSAVAIIKQDAFYTAAVAAGDAGSDEQKALVAAVNAAEALEADATNAQVISAAQDLYNACTEANISGDVIAQLRELANS